MNKENEINCSEEDFFNHMLIEQITRICVLEEDERIREEMKNSNDNRK